MTTRPQLGTPRHTVLERPSEGLEPLASAPLTDRQRIAVLLQLAGSLQLLQGLGIPRLDRFGVDHKGLLRLQAGASQTEERRERSSSQQVLLDAIDRLFEPAQGIVQGRGVARRVARVLQQLWGQSLVGLTTDRVVADLLNRAPFLWEDRYGPARAALAVERAPKAGECDAVWIAGPGRFRRRVLRHPRHFLTPSSFSFGRSQIDV